MDQHVVPALSWSRGAPPDACLPPPDGQDEPARRREDVRHAVDAEIALALSPAALSLDAATLGPRRLDHGVTEGEVAAFVEALLAHADDGRIAGLVAALRARGVPLESIYLTLFQPAARRIGDLWADDRCSFLDVTLAVGALQTLLRGFEPQFQATARPGGFDRNALLLPLPGDQHTFGLSMVTEFFRRAGWSVWSAALPALADLGDAVRGSRFALVGFSLSSEARLDELAAAIRLVRERSCNPAVGILVGGPIFALHPAHVARVGADGVGRDADEALVLAESFVFSGAV